MVAEGPERLGQTLKAVTALILSLVLLHLLAVAVAHRQGIPQLPGTAAPVAALLMRWYLEEQETHQAHHRLKVTMEEQERLGQVVAVAAVGH